MRIDCDRHQLESMFDTHIPANVEILFCALWSDTYEESIQVIYRIDDQIFECRGGHYSCYGFEGQWDGTRVTLNYLKTAKHWDASDVEWAELIEFLERESAQKKGAE